MKNRKAQSKPKHVVVEIDERSVLFVLKSFKLMAWSEASLKALCEEHRKKENLVEMERVMFIMLALISSLHECLASCAKCLGKEQWRNDLNSIRQSDSLLFYMWKARDSDIHDALIKWQTSTSLFHIRIVDPAKAAHIVTRENAPNDPTTQSLRAAGHLFAAGSLEEIHAKITSGVRPTSEAQAEIGVQMRMFLGDVVLLPFTVRVKGKSFPVPAPRIHLGTFHHFALESAFSMALVFYKGKLAELVQHLASLGVQVPPPAQV